ncbi:mitofusin-1 isoform X2 [Pimephales promelas]|uniref:mitofusin-1 isoform X2 n=1 Tax=Pimephales promelas TaxID=90988 RepID=UPI0019558256|nr:mitofusin-1 isoform X2 [Pimephales promelas]KAG1937844.1 mitofusin-2 [Pimephales promelas]
MTSFEKRHHLNCCNSVVRAVLNMEQDDVSPLQHFVVAKRTISAMFQQMLEYVREGSDFVEETRKSEDLEHVAEEEQCLQIQACSRKLSVINDVLARRHMKVAFFGRTSNGKSTVINAMLRERVLPSGIGHTTNCFLSVEGTDGEHAYLTTEDSEERKSIETVNHLAHALHMDRNQDSGCLVRVFWPKTKCAVLRDDLVLMDSPGTDVTSELDSWIDKFCLDADVFVLVANSESTIMNTEKHFFHKVNERISKPNIFILNNRWDASVLEPEYLEDVRKQHMDRCVSFLVEELKVVDLHKAPDRIFFVSAKEVLSARIHRAQGMPETGGALAEGFQERLMEFQSFERTFEEFISQSAVKTKFEQHTIRAWQIIESVKAIMDAINISSAEKKVFSLEEREAQMDRLEFVRNQLNFLTEDIKDKIKAIADEVAAKVSSAMAEEICFLSVLVDEFCADFSPAPNALTLYKTKLMAYAEERMAKNLDLRCSSTINGCVMSSQRDIMDTLRPLLPPAARGHLHLPHRRFTMTYDLNFSSLCENFVEDIDFHFSLGLTSLVNRFLGPAKAKQALSLLNQNLKVTSSSAQTQDELAISMATGLVSFTSRASVGVLVTAGVVWRSVGWRVVVLSVSLYGLLYLYERVTWTNSSKERALKQQFVDYATQRLQAISHILSSDCGQQVQQEMVAVFARMCQQVDKSEMELETEIRRLSARIQRLESVQRRSKTLRHKATDLESRLESFSAQYLQIQH